MNCYYPLCRQPALFTPVVEVPTIRTVGIAKPVLPRLVLDSSVMKRAELDQRIAIDAHVAAMKDYIEHRNDVVHTDRPTYLICREVCQKHRDSYVLQDWFQASDWKVMQEAARSRGFHLEDSGIITVTFKPIGWLPFQSTEVTRDRMALSE